MSRLNDDDFVVMHVFVIAKTLEKNVFQQKHFATKAD